MDLDLALRLGRSRLHMRAQRLPAALPRGSTQGVSASSSAIGRARHDVDLCRVAFEDSNAVRASNACGMEVVEERRHGFGSERQVA